MSKNQIIQKIVDIFYTINDDFLLGLVGSAVYSDNYQDLDFLLLTNNIRFIKSNIYAIFENFSIKEVDDALKINDFHDVEISIAMYELNQTINRIDNFLSGKKENGEHRSWTLGYWVPEGLALDISRIQILKDSNGQLLSLKNKLQNYSIYARKKIISCCIEELEQKSILYNNKTNALERSIIKNDIILCLIRGHYAINREYLIGFKNLSNIIDKLPPDLKKTISDITDGDLSPLNSIINAWKGAIFWNKTLYLGTWQFGGGFKQFKDEEIINIIKFAKKSGIKKFDTALVYGNGNVEKLLSRVVADDDVVLTKIPGIIKFDAKKVCDLYEYYTEKHILDCVNSSSKNLKKSIDIVLLHNWLSNWNNEPEIINWLLKLKKNKLAKRIGISLPNNYDNKLSKNVLEKIDVIEAPYNAQNKWILNDLDVYKSFNIEIILRSLFIQGKTLTNGIDDYIKIIKEAKILETSLVIGMTTEEQIKNNIKILVE
jgi:aryl-alcohol dehydrogenase-like predicted oxidoreductase